MLAATPSPPATCYGRTARREARETEGRGKNLVLVGACAPSCGARAAVLDGAVGALPALPRASACGRPESFAWPAGRLWRGRGLCRGYARREPSIWRSRPLCTTLSAAATTRPRPTAGLQL